jgi:MarR family transcriptional regulator for hemolysin
VDLEFEEPPFRLIDATIMSTARVMRRAYDERLAPLGLNLSEARMVVFVAEFGPETQTRLAGRLGLGRAAAGQMIDKLEREGLVTRIRDKEDRRVWLIGKTKKTNALRDRIVDETASLRDELRAGISHEERAALASTLRRLQDNLTAILGGATEDAEALL